MEKYACEVEYSESFDIIPGMWLWVKKSGKIYGGFLKEGKDELYIKDNGKRIGLTDNEVIIPYVIRYITKPMDD